MGQEIFNHFKLMTTQSHSKKLYIKSYGCQMNTYDAKRMEDILRPLGYQSTELPDDADMVILNTCHIREKATDKVFSDLGRMREHKVNREQNGKEMIIAVAGCVAQAEGDVILQRAKYVDMVFGPQTYHLLPEMVTKINSSYGYARVINTDFPVEEKFDHLPQDNAVSGPTAHLSIQEGCDKFCTFCVVPYTRGSEYSRKVLGIMDEARRLIDQGVKDITLLGQNVNAYHGEAPDGSIWSLARLIEELDKLEGLARIRYTTSHPCDVLDDLVAAHRDVPKLMPYLHLPVQSGSDKILKAMNRKHTVQSYLETIAKFRAARPDIALSSDFIVGFPGETDEDFEATLSLVRQLPFGSAFTFKYSARPGTPAANMQGLVPEKVKDERLQRLQALITASAETYNQSFVGKTLEVLFDGRQAKEGQLHGRTAYNQAVHADAHERLYGTVAEVEITRAGHMALHGHVKTANN
ncbi:MAG: tRNA (N6-isopentenyl adenosine(37)-C2)-methylthiotransferase MiaB [Pseudobdellovibrionaceae bacterium]